MTQNFAEAVHPTGGTWVCGSCELRIQAGHLCPDCGNVLCDGCVEKPHQHPAGARAGKRCKNSPMVEAEPEATPDPDLFAGPCYSATRPEQVVSEVAEKLAVKLEAAYETLAERLNWQKFG